ncbi:uncharacterized protein LOC144179383 [Haemaphysalis longicornis]
MADYYGEATVRRGSSTGSPQPNEACVPQGVKVSAQKLERNCRKAFYYCYAFVDVKIKKVTKATQQNDPFLNWPVSLTAVIRMHEVLNHGLDCADGLRLLKPTSDTTPSTTGSAGGGEGSIPTKE